MRYAWGMAHRNHAYLSVLSWPEGFTDDRKIEALVMAAALDPHQAKLSIRRSTPSVIASIEAEDAPEILRVLHKMGVLALAPSLAQFADYPQPESPSSVELFPEKDLGAFAVRTRDGGAWTFQAPELRMVVFGKARAITTHVRSEPSSGGSYIAVAGFGAAVVAASEGQSGLRYERNMSVQPVLDLHIHQHTPQGVVPRLVRLTGGRTRIGLIGDGDPRPSLLKQSDPIADLRAHAPDARYELGFDRFSPPADARYRSCFGGGTGSHRLSGESFHFFSVWSALLDRMLRG